MQPALGALLSDDPEAALEDLAPDDLASRCREKKAKRYMPSCEALKADLGGLCSADLTQDQKQAFDKIVSKKHGLVLLAGGPGSGKSFLTRRLIMHFAQQGRKTLITGVSGTAAKNLSSFASTVHSTFSIPSETGQTMLTLGITHPMRPVLTAAEVIFIDEVSMMSTGVFDNVIIRLQQLHQVSSREELFKKILIIWVGDDAQVGQSL